MDEYWKPALPLAAVLGAIILLFTLLNGIPWAAKTDVAVLTGRVDKTEALVGVHAVQLGAQAVHRDELAARLNRLEGKIDMILSKLPQYPAKSDFAQ